VTLVDPQGETSGWWDRQFDALAAVTPVPAEGEPTGRAFTRVVAGDVQGFISLEGIVDVDVERDRLRKAADDAASTLDRIEKKLANKNFVERAPADVVGKERAKAEELGARVSRLRSQLVDLG
jgi:valyl-tRNA synthetase